MKRQSIRIVTLLATVTLIGIVATQIYWVRKAFNIQEKEFNERVHIALVNVAQDILDVNHDPSELYDPVVQISSNYFVVSMNDTLHPFLLQSLLSKEFSTRNINIDFEYVIYDCFSDSLVFGNYVSVADQEKDRLQALSSDDFWNRDGHYFGVYFPSKKSYIISKMDMWMFSSLLIIFVILFFGYSIYTILQQKRLSEIKNDFINNMTHEFKTPISTIGLSSGVLMEKDIAKEPGRIKTYATIINDENKRLQQLVDKVLQLATLNKKDVELEPEKVDLHEVIRKASDSFNLTLKESGGSISLALHSTYAMVNGDMTHLTNVIYNLIDNAIKYAKDAPVIEIETTDKGKQLIIEVRDYGIGIDEKNKKHIFKKFYRVPTGNLHNVKGFGLGLYYVKTIVEAHKGKITINSTPGKGSTFIISLPKAK